MCVMVMCICACAVTTERQYLLLESGSLNRAISLGVERTLFSVESAGLYFWRMRTSFFSRVPLARFEQTRRRGKGCVTVAKTSSKQVRRLVHGNYAL